MNNSDIKMWQICEYREAMGCGWREGRRERKGCWVGSDVWKGGSMKGNGIISGSREGSWQAAGTRFGY